MFNSFLSDDQQGQGQPNLEDLFGLPKVSQGHHYTISIANRFSLGLDSVANKLIGVVPERDLEELYEYSVQICDAKAVQ